MHLNVSFPNELNTLFEKIKTARITRSNSEVVREAIRFYYDFLFTGKNTYSYKNGQGIELMELAADLPGMSLAVIQSHLVRFPKVTPEIYRRILERLNAQHAEGTLKNPEAAAYGLCKLAQNGKLPDGIIAAPPAPAAQEAAPQQTLVPKQALMPFAK